MKFKIVKWLKWFRRLKEYRIAKEQLTNSLLEVPGVFGVGFSDTFGVDEIFVHHRGDVSVESIVNVISEMELQTGFVWDIRLVETAT